MADVTTDKYGSIVIDAVRVDEGDLISFITTAGEEIIGNLHKIGGGKKERKLLVSITGDDFARTYSVDVIAKDTIKVVPVEE